MDDVPLLLLLLVLSGFFSGAEIALFSLSAEKIQALRKKAETRAELQKVVRLEALKSDPQRLLVTILIGNNVVNVASSALATVMGTKIATEYGVEDNTALVLGAVTGVMTFLLLLFGEITPKSLAHRYAVQFSLLTAPLISFLQIALWPIVAPLSKLVAKMSGGQSEETNNGLTEDELKAALELSEQEGKIQASEKEWVERILELGEHNVASVMTPRSKVFAYEDTTDVEEVLAGIRDARYSRIPIYHDDLDEVTGILSVHAVIDKMSDPDFMTQNVANLPLKKPFKVPVTMKIDTLLEDFRKERTHMALVYDEHGGLVGLITLEDILEEVFGEIQDEQDEERLEIRQAGKAKFSCSSEVELEQLEAFISEKMSVNMPDVWPWELEDENKTVGLFLLEKLEKFPEVGEQIKLSTLNHDFAFTVTVAEEDRILEADFEIQERVDALEA